jgi:hypothetical protein
MPTTAPGTAQNAEASGINAMTIRASALCAQRRCTDIRAFIERCASLPAAILNFDFDFKTSSCPNLLLNLGADFPQVMRR